MTAHQKGKCQEVYGGRERKKKKGYSHALTLKSHFPSLGSNLLEAAVVGLVAIASFQLPAQDFFRRLLQTLATARSLGKGLTLLIMELSVGSLATLTLRGLLQD